MTTEEYLQARKGKQWKFNTVVQKDAFLQANKIHPIKQKIVKEIVDSARLDPEVRKIIIFGSATRYDCDMTSDLDICIDWASPCYDEDGVLLPFTANMRKAISGATKGMADVVNYSELGNTIVEEAVKNGVTVYERNV
ncbi:MAG: hypothetical protein IKS55_07835 [Oscillospiraceae bacterium]|nr:hypothetical protein [Oscillospiraceae bacterium]